MLQGAGTIALLSNALPLEALRAVFPYWFVTWIWQNCGLEKLCLTWVEPRQPRCHAKSVKLRMCEIVGLGRSFANIGLVYGIYIIQIYPSMTMILLWVA